MVCRKLRSPRPKRFTFRSKRFRRHTGLKSQRQKICKRPRKYWLEISENASKKGLCYTREMAKKRAKNEMSEVLEIVSFLKDHMVENMMTKEEGASKADILRIEERLYSIEQELKEIKRRLTILEDAFEKTGYQNKQEIEELWKRVAAIEKRLKMQRA